jgi:outer membrane receptor protein involved in Fe transport
MNNGQSIAAGILLASAAISAAPAAARQADQVPTSSGGGEVTQEIVVFGRSRDDTVLTVPQTVIVLGQGVIEQTGQHRPRDRSHCCALRAGILV